MNTKTRALEIYQQHLELASTDGRLFRKTVMDQLQSECGLTLSSAATHYNNCKKSIPVEGLGRIQSNSVRKNTNKNKSVETIPDNECFTVMELIKKDTEFTVGRIQSFVLQGDASESFDSKSVIYPESTWVMIQGLGPNSGDTFNLAPDEKEIKRHSVV